MERQKDQTLYYDPEPSVSACCMEGGVQPFPRRFHPYFVVGTLRRGRRQPDCGGSVCAEINVYNIFCALRIKSISDDRISLYVKNAY